MKVDVTSTAVGPGASTLQYHATKFDIWALGITMVLGGQLFSWNAGLVAGIVSNAVAILVLGVGYVCLVLSMAEMTSTLAFSGGAYGLTRCSIGFYAGWVIGCCEALEYIAYTASAVLTLSDMLYIAFPTLHADVAPVLWLLTYGICNVLLACSDRVFWLVNRFLALLSLMLVLVYLGGAYSLSEFSHRVTSDANRLVVGGGVEFLRRLPFAAWFFVGIEALSTVCNVVPTPKEVIPLGQVACVLTLFALAVLVFTAAVGVAPDVMSITTDVAVLSRGYERILHLSPADAMMLSIPATFATIFGFVLAYSNILAAMASSHLLPVVLTRQLGWSHTHPIATLLGSLLGFGMCFLVREFETLRDELFNIGMVLAFAAYAAQCVGYMYLKQRFAHLPRAFRSPLGVYGAFLSLTIWLVNIVSVLAFQDHVAYKLQVLAGLLLLQSIYYHMYAKHKQQMSEDERKVLFFAHVANANDAKRKMNRKSRSRMSSTIERVVRRIVVWPHARNKVSVIAPSTRPSINTMPCKNGHR
ncbi:hypothetical protein SPRG_09664 [Saprolegnia parasitica CBS 223.65]|uniref:Amino acid permease/ SLC12A domain-containing protein n=1 Tax=Saprolegnia parasitica (strain CBS 223.65) TaxID=695850 RepID=A0A067CE63_SAPPC|nr:hypothetical protein SPRG_09664 [Saprolegnia parasitica CBS 223.65]KDO24831.1 hypothetical protein SPRG_09664 [Saprolegnia parasitica CBS 223.65]|eukprot:XP_012204479.1 hypothetical protein SPRG_09664 [Saprolegnia parasitica CBS 223.65]